MSAGENPESERARLVEDTLRSPSEDQPGTHTLHLNPAAEFHPRVLLPGDPARAMAIATGQLTAPRMFNHRRGLWGYSGVTAGGTGVVVQSTGMGGPSAAIVCEELVQLGAELFLRVGTCAAIAPGPKLGDLIVVTECIRDDGTSQTLGNALGEGERVLPDAELTQVVLQMATGTGHTTHAGVAATVDLFYDPRGKAWNEKLAADGALCLDMECATVLSVARQHGIPAACLLVVSDELYAGDRRRLTTPQLGEAGDLLGLVGVRAVEATAGRRPADS